MIDMIIRWLEKRLAKKKHEVIKLKWKQAELEQLKKNLQQI